MVSRRARGDTRMSGGSKLLSLIFDYWQCGEILTSLAMYSPGQDIVRSVAGPMACSLATIERYMEVLPDARPWEVDHHVAPVSWRTKMASCGVKQLKIGFLVDDGVVKVQPPIARAMREVVDALKAAGHEGMKI